MNAKKLSLTLLGLIFRVVIAIAIIILVYNVSTKAYQFGYRIFAEEPVSEEPGIDISVTITDSETAMDIGKLLVRDGLIADSKLFYVQAILFDKKDKFLPGEYVLNTSETSIAMMELMTTKPTEETSDAGSSSSDISNDDAQTNIQQSSDTDTDNASTNADNSGTEMDQTDTVKPNNAN